MAGWSALCELGGWDRYIRRGGELTDRLGKKLDERLVSFGRVQGMMDEAVDQLLSTQPVLLYPAPLPLCVQEGPRSRGGFVCGR